MLLYPGNTDFEQSAPAQWQPNGWDLDRLVVPYRGDVDQLDAFIDDLEMWAPSTIDEDMFLESWPNDGHQQFPTVSLTFIGKKGGVLPPSKTMTGNAVQSASHNDDTVDPALSVDITFLAPTSTVTAITRSSRSSEIPAGEFSVSPVLIYAKRRNASGAPLSYFNQSTITVRSAEELVPGQYWRHTIVKQALMFS